MSVTISNLGYKIKIKDDVINIMKSYKQLRATDCEAGGILIGYETLNGDIIIEYATKPYTWDKRSRYSFFRKDKKHNRILQSIWKEQGEIHIYIGEWHTHPEEYPKYSLQDKNNWIEIGNKMNKRNFIHIILGNSEIGIWRYDAKNKKILKIGAFMNEE